ncbi:MAG: glucose-6-phosphate dehydrogenase assembly protein OpcA [Chloroflexota bacterium]|nr:glucose-6-phosphate dehydrogenase assembly protein OpcA [Chloroflexota bacterium]
MSRSTADDGALSVHRRLMRLGVAESAVAEPWAERDTSVRAVGAQLARLWAVGEGDGEPVVTEKGLPHSRASVLNLIVTVPDDAAAERVVATMLGLGFRHPSRAIVLVADPDAPGPPLDAAISAHCHDGHDGTDRACYEAVVLGVRGEAARHLSGIVAPLLIHDLPTYVWWPGDPPFADAIFDQLVEMSDRVIVDSGDFADLLVGMRRLTTLRRRSGVGDLAWRRLGWWQELTAQFFDAPRFRRYLPNLNRLAIRYAVPAAGSGAASASPLAGAVLYAGWIAARLTWRRHRTVGPLTNGSLRLSLEGRHEMVDLRIEAVPTDAFAPGDLLSVRLRAFGETGAAEFVIERSGGEAVVATNADGMTALLRRVTMEPSTEAELLAADLLNDRHDPIYEEALRAAAVFLSAARPIEAGG